MCAVQHFHENVHRCEGDTGAGEGWGGPLLYFFVHFSMLSECSICMHALLQLAFCFKSSGGFSGEKIMAHYFLYFYYLLY